MSTADHILDASRFILDHNRQLVAENAELRARTGPVTPRFDSLRNGQEVTPQQLEALQSAKSKWQDSGRLCEVTTTDAVGRRISHFFGDPKVAFAPFMLPTRRILAIGPHRGRQ